MGTPENASPTQRALRLAIDDHLGQSCDVSTVQTWDGSIVLEVRASTHRFFAKAQSRTSVLPEAWALEAAHSAGAKVPAVRHRGWMPTDDGPVPWMLLDAVEGSPWALPEDLSSIDGSIYRWIAAQLRLVHGIRASGAGTFDAEGRPSATSWARWLIDRIDGLFAATGLPDEGFRDRLIAAIGRQQKLLDSRPIGLVHADLGNREILVGEDAAPQGFVDFGNAIFGDPILDLAGFMRGGLPDDRRPPHMLPPLVEAYYEGITLPDRFVWLWTLYGIVHDLHNIRWSQREGLEDWVPLLWANVRRSVMLLELPD